MGIQEFLGIVEMMGKIKQSNTSSRIVFRTGIMAVKKLSKMRCLEADWTEEALGRAVVGAGHKLSSFFGKHGFMRDRGDELADVMDQLYIEVPGLWFPKNEEELFQVQERLIFELTRLWAQWSELSGLAGGPRG